VKVKSAGLFGIGPTPPAAGKASGDRFVEKDGNGGDTQQLGNRRAKIVEKLIEPDDGRERPEKLLTLCADRGCESPRKRNTNILEEGGHNPSKIRAEKHNRKGTRTRNSTV
jgi:hypothetical protein